MNEQTCVLGRPANVSFKFSTTALRYIRDKRHFLPETRRGGGTPKKGSLEGFSSIRPLLNRLLQRETVSSTSAAHRLHLQYAHPSPTSGPNSSSYVTQQHAPGSSKSTVLGLCEMRQ